MMFRKPILALTEGGPTGEIVSNYGLGIVARSDSADAIEGALRQLISGDWQPQPCGWDRALTDFDGRQLTKSLAERLNESCESSRSPTAV